MHKITLSAVDPMHKRATLWARSYRGHDVSFPQLSADAEAWAMANTPGYVVSKSRAANFLIDVTFANERDAVLFKMFWLTGE
jgi:hypothetical protein